MENTTPKQLVDRLANAIGPAWAKCLKLPQPFSIVVPDQPIQSSLLVFKVIVPDGTSLDDMLTAFHDVKTSTNVVFDSWEGSVNDLWIRAGLDVFTGIREDRGLLSRTHSIVNDLPFESPRRLQLIKLTKGDRPPQTSLAADILMERQDMAYFLRYSLRLNPQDLAFVLDFLGRTRWRWRDLRKICALECKSEIL